MATGITKKNWLTTPCIVTSEDYAGDASFELTYKGKLPDSEVVATLPQNTYEELYNNGNKNRIFYGDNLDVLRYLHHVQKLSGKINLIYIDPPFGTNSVFQSRNQKDSYRDDLVGSHYIEFMRRRLILLRELLSDEGSIYIHLDGNMIFQIKVVMDEIFGTKNFRGFITRRKCGSKNSTKNTFGNISDYIIFYSKSDAYKWHRPVESWGDDKIEKEYPCIDEMSGKRYKKVPLHAPGVRHGKTGEAWNGMLPPPGKHWQYTPEKLTELDNRGEIFWSSNGNPRRKLYLDQDKGIPVQDIWLNLQDSLNQNIKITGYPTEKNPCLLERIINASSDIGDLVLDCFAGSGTTLDVASQLGRRFIGVDNSFEAISNILKRFSVGVEEMGDFVNKKGSVNRNAEQGLLLFDMERIYNADVIPNNDFTFSVDTRYTDFVKDLVDFYLIEEDKSRKTA